MDLPPVSGMGGPDRSRLSPAARALVPPLRGEEAEAARRKGLEAANRRRRSKAEEALLEALRPLQARGERCLRHLPFQGLLGALQAAVEGLTGEGQTPVRGPGLPQPHTFPPLGGLPPHAPSCGVYAERPGDPLQLYAGRPPLQALSGPSRKGKSTFAKMGLAPSPALPVPWKRRCYRRRS
jgi:hypothetical protein